METTGEGKTPQKTPQSLPPCPLKLLRPPHTTRISEPNPDDRLTTPGFACSPSVPQGTHTDSSAYLCTQKKRPPSECGNLRNVHIRPDPDLFFFLFFSGYTRICPRILQASVSGNSITLFFKYQFYIYIYIYLFCRRPSRAIASPSFSNREAKYSHRAACRARGSPTAPCVARSPAPTIRRGPRESSGPMGTSGPSRTATISPFEACRLDVAKVRIDAGRRCAHIRVAAAV